MRASTVLIASFLALTAPLGAETALAEGASSGHYQPVVPVTAAPALGDTGSQAYPSFAAGAGAHRVTLSAAPPVFDAGSQGYPSSATGAGERDNSVIAGGAIVVPAGSEGEVASVNSFPPGFTNSYLARR